MPCAWQPDSVAPHKSGQPDWRDPSTRLSSDNHLHFSDKPPVWSAFGGGGELVIREAEMFAVHLDLLKSAHYLLLTINLSLS